MKLSEVVSLVFKRTIELGVSIKKHGSTGVSLNGTPFISSSLNTNLSEFFSIVPVVEELSKTDPNFILHISSSPAAFLAGLRHELDKQTESLAKMGESEINELKIDLGFPEEDSVIGDFEFLQEQRSRNNIWVYCKPLGKSAELSRATFDSQLSLFPKEVRPLILSKIRVGSVTYHPALPTGIFNASERCQIQHGLHTSTVLNIYKAPAWKSEYSEPRLHPTLKKLFDFVFVGEKCREHVYRWIYSLLYTPDAPMPILVVYSSGGVGKGRVFEAVIASLVGRNNFQKPASSHYGRFDSHLLSCHLYYASEAVLTEDSAARFKDLYDGYAAAEHKGVDIGKPRKIAARFVLSSNHAQSLYMNYDSRKFSVPDTRKGEALKNHMTEEELQFLEEFKVDFKEQAAFAAWIRENHGPLKFEEVWHGKDFIHLCEYHLEGWFKSFRNMLEKNTLFSLEEFRGNLPRGVNKVSAAKVLEVLTKYQYETKTEVCIVHPSPDGFDAGVTYESKIFKGEANEQG